MVVPWLIHNGTSNKTIAYNTSNQRRLLLCLMGSSTKSTLGGGVSNESVEDSSSLRVGESVQKRTCLTTRCGHNNGVVCPREDVTDALSVLSAMDTGGAWC